MTPPYGLCLLISCSLGDVRVADVLKDVAIILVPMLILLIVVILFPEFVLFLPRWITPKFL
ncbi:MAG: TRAP-type C4-dicarboxylate transport system permease large subunit [Planctomycetaceae bacterium]